MAISDKDELFMQRALDLAEQGRGLVSPNPLVGCVIVKDDRILAEGFHEKYGSPHAEANAINAVADKNLLTGSTLFVNLEPCAHFGKTAPCADLIVQYPFQRVVICNIDPNPLVSGKGIEKIKTAGIEVTEGVLKEEGRILNKRFFIYIEKRRPYVILKWAETADGFIAREDFSSKWISNEASRALVHRWRSEEDAVMVGTNTALYDNPKLNVREWKGRNPLRIVIDNQLKISAEAHLLDRTQPTLCYNLIKEQRENDLTYIKISKDQKSSLFILEDLYSRNIQSLMIEGGAKLLADFIKAGLWDEVRVFKSPVKFEKGIKAPDFKGLLSATEWIGEDQLQIYKNV